jgi:hypothetical protein
MDIFYLVSNEKLYMKTKIIKLLYFVLVIFVSCNKYEDPITNCGLNFHLTKNNLVDDFITNYDTINIDTIVIYGEPFISYSNIAYYDTSKYNEVILILRNNKANIDFAGNLRMFVAKLDNNPIYIGFLWSRYMSKGSSWIFIEDPLEENILKSNELRILTNSKCENYVLNPLLLERLRNDNKLK